MGATRHDASVRHHLCPSAVSPNRTQVQTGVTQRIMTRKTCGMMAAFFGFEAVRRLMSGIGTTREIAEFAEMVVMAFIWIAIRRMSD